MHLALEEAHASERVLAQEPLSRFLIRNAYAVFSASLPLLLSLLCSNLVLLAVHLQLTLVLLQSGFSVSSTQLSLPPRLTTFPQPSKTLFTSPLCVL